MTGVQWLRLFILCAYASTFVVCAVRVLRTREPKARVGNVAFGWVCLVFWLAQIPFWRAPLTWLTVLTAVGAGLCIGYLITLARKGL